MLKLIVASLLALCIDTALNIARASDTDWREEKEPTQAQIEAAKDLARHVRTPLEGLALFDVPPDSSCPETYGSIGFHKNYFTLTLPKSAIKKEQFPNFGITPTDFTSGWVLYNSTCWVDIEISVKVLVDGKWTTVPVTHKDGLKPQ